MKGFQPEWRGRLFGPKSIVLGVAWLALALGCPLGLANPLFAGVTGLEAATTQSGDTQSLIFLSDLPFQYQTQIQDANHVILRLYNARLADSLVNPEGSVNFLPGGSIESARLRKPDPKSVASGDYQEIILSGSGLGKKKLKITGASEMPLPLAKSVANLAEPFQVKRLEPTDLPSRPAPFKTSQSLTNLARVEARQNNQQTNRKPEKAFRKLVQEPVAMMAVSDAKPATSANDGPQIASVTDVAGRRPASGLPMMVENIPRYAPPSYQPVQEAEPGVLSEPEAKRVEAGEAPEPSYQVLTSLPRYQGGAAPIRAMTTDQNGKAVLVRPRNQAIPEFFIASGNDGYNTLFQAEGESSAQKVSRLMAEALKSYQENQFKQALEAIQQALLLDNDNADLYAALAEIQIKLNQPRQASESYAKAFGRMAEKYGQRYAQVLVLSGQRQQAIELLKKIEGQNANQADVAYMLGTLYEEMGQTTEALPYLKQAAQLHPASADIQYNLGLAYELSGDRLLAERHYQKALSLNNSAVDARKALARVRTDLAE